MSTPGDSRKPWLMRLFQLEADEAVPVVASFFYYFFLLCGYYILRPVRDALGILAGVGNLQWLFTATFVAMLVAVPAYGWLSSRFQPRRFLPWLYFFFIANIAVFFFFFQAQPDNVWIARVFYVWLSVFNLFIVSVFWTVMANFYAPSQSRRLFGLIAAGGSAGALVGPAVTVLLVERLGYAYLFPISAVVLSGALLTLRVMLRHSRHGRQRLDSMPALGGNPFAGLKELLSSPYLAAIGLFIVLYSTTSTFLYFQQAELVRDAFSSNEARTQVLGYIDLSVNVLSVLGQLFLTGRVANRFGVGPTLAAIPLLLAAGFLSLAAAPILAVLMAVQIARRAGNYAITRPAREMLFTVVDDESKFKAKNVIDTVVYRGGDAVSSWIYTGLAAAGFGLGGTAAVGAGLALGMAGMGLYLGGRVNDVAVGGRAQATAVPAADRNG